MVPHDATPLEFAEKIEETCNLPDYLSNEIHQANYTLLANFERERVAQQYVSLAFNMPTGFYGDLKVGEVSDKVKNKTEEVMSDFFKLSKEV